MVVDDLISADIHTHVPEDAGYAALDDGAGCNVHSYRSFA